MRRACKPNGTESIARSRIVNRPRVNPLLVLGGAVAAGFLIAKVIDWRGHAHPRG
jgi:hypothetical protein